MASRYSPFFDLVWVEDNVFEITHPMVQQFMLEDFGPPDMRYASGFLAFLYLLELASGDIREAGASRFTTLNPDCSSHYDIDYDVSDFDRNFAFDRNMHTVVSSGNADPDLAWREAWHFTYGMSFDEFFNRFYSWLRTRMDDYRENDQYYTDSIVQDFKQIIR